MGSQVTTAETYVDMEEPMISAAYLEWGFHDVVDNKASSTAIHIEEVKLDDKSSSSQSLSPEATITEQASTPSNLPLLSSDFSHRQSHPQKSALLSLPLEIRLQIYSYLLPLHPAKHAHLSPSSSYPPATSSAYFLRALSSTLALSFPNFEPAGKSEPGPFPSIAAAPLSRGEGCGFIPAALLMTCVQVYEECRVLPWQQNEYVFINWFCSGVYAARAFLRALKPWQRSEMRWARVEVLGRDLKDTWVATMVGGRAGGGEWRDLCGLWAGDVVNGTGGGLWGLKLGIKGRVGNSVVSVEADGSGGEVSKNEIVKGGVLDVDSDWVNNGLMQMKALRWMEIEIEDEDVDRDYKVHFCVALGKKLSSPGRKVDVLLVEKVVEKQNATLASREELAWGEPGDDYIWGLDS